QSLQVRTECVIRTAERPTIVKTRIIAQHQQVVRFDREQKGVLSSSTNGAVMQQIERTMPEVRAVVLSDYAKGVISPTVIEKTIALARRRKIPVTVDPKVENFSRYRHVT